MIHVVCFSPVTDNAYSKALNKKRIFSPNVTILNRTITKGDEYPHQLLAKQLLSDLEL